MENTGENSGSRVIPGPHGGSIRTGGNPGNKGGGRPKDEIRALCASNLAKATELIQKRLEQESELTLEQIIKAADVSGKYSIGTKSEVDTVVKDPEIISHIIAVCVDEFGVDRLKLVDRLEELNLVQ